MTNATPDPTPANAARLAMRCVELKGEVERLRESVISQNRRAEALAARIVNTRKALLMGGQTADIRCRSAIAALDGAE